MSHLKQNPANIHNRHKRRKKTASRLPIHEFSIKWKIDYLIKNLFLRFFLLFRSSVLEVFMNKLETIMENPVT